MTDRPKHVLTSGIMKYDILIVICFLWEINKGGTADSESVLYLKGQIFLFCGQIVT